VSEIHISNENKLADRMKRIEQAQEVMYGLMSNLVQFRAEITNKMNEIDVWITALGKLSAGELPEQLVTVVDVQKVLDHVQKAIIEPYKNEFVMSHKNPAFYYMLKSITYARTAKFIFVTVSIPIHSVGGVLAVYRVDHSHITTAEAHTGSTRIANLPDFFAVTGNYYTEMSTAHYMTCRGAELRMCPTERSLQEKSSATCASALFYNDMEKAMEVCDIRNEERPEPSGGVQLADHSYLVHSNDMTAGLWMLTCANAAAGFYEQPMDPCNTCVVHVPCMCKLTTPEFIIPYQLTGCKISEDPNYPKLTRKYPINVAFLRSLFSTNITKDITGGKLRGEKWSIPLPKIVMTTFDWKEVSERDERYRTDFKEQMRLQKKDVKTYKSKEDALLAKANNFHDLTMSHLKGLANVFTGKFWKNVFTPGNITGRVSVLTILVVCAIVFSVYNCVMARRGR